MKNTVNALILGYELAAADPLRFCMAHVVAQTICVLSSKAACELPGGCGRVDRAFAAVINVGNADYLYWPEVRRYVIGLRAAVTLIEFQGSSGDPDEGLKLALQEQVIVGSCAPVFIPVMAIQHMELEI